VAVIGGSLAFPRDARAQGNLVVTITSPTSGSTVSGTITVSASVSPLGVLVGGVQFKLDGASLGAEDKAAPYAVSWNTTGVGNGSHSLTAVARDALGLQYSSSPVTVTVSNAPPPDTTPPAVNITSPGSGATVSGTTSVTASASDNVGVAGVQFKIDGANLGGEDTTSPYAISWDTTTAANGSHSLTATARDAAGNSTTSTTVIVSVSNTSTGGTTRIEENDPSVAYTGNWIPQSRADLSGGSIVEGPDAGSTASLTFNGTGVSWIGFRADFGGIAEVYLDGVLKATVDTYSPTQQAQAVMYTASGLASGTHTVMIRVTGTWSASACCTWIVVDAFDVTSGGGGTPPPDTTPPTVGITSPTKGASVSGTIAVSAAASDNVGVAGVQFLLDSVALGPEDTTAPYSVSWNTTTVSNGSHTLSATARDAAGNKTTSAPVTVTVSNSAPPSSTRFEESSATLSPAASWIALTSTSTGVTLSGDSATAAADAGATASFTFTGQGVSWIGFKCEQCGIASVLLDGSVVATVDTYAPTRPAASGSMFSVTGLAAGNHTLVIQVTGNKNASSASTYVVVDAFDVM